VFFLAAPTPRGLLVTICIAIVICIVIAIWQGQKKEEDYQRLSSYQRPYREQSPPARLKQPSPSRYEIGYQGEEFARYDDYEQPQAQYPGQRPSVPRK
jgi:hypothetical protein